MRIRSAEAAGIGSATDGSYEVVVVGCSGGVGSAALYHLARRGIRVLGLDPYPVGHRFGSSHGHTRIIRLAYFEHPDYVPLLRHAYESWGALAEEAEQPLFRRTGLVQVGTLDGQVVPGVLRSASMHDLRVEQFDAAEAAAMFPSLVVEDGEVAVHEPDAGYLLVEACVTAHATLASRHGAHVRTGVAVRGIASSGGGVSVETDDGTVMADAVVVAAGAWTTPVLGDVGMPFEVRRKHVYWYDPNGRIDVTDAPAFLFELPGGVFYGIPSVDASGVKVAEHTGGRVVDPDTADRADDPVARARVAAFARARLPGVGSRLLRHEACLYTMSPDGNFVVDRHPTIDGVVFAAGLSGHGFKLVGVIGEILADLATSRSSPLPHHFLALRDP